MQGLSDIAQESRLDNKVRILDSQHQKDTLVQVDRDRYDSTGNTKALTGAYHYNGVIHPKALYLDQVSSGEKCNNDRGEV